jgi:hypothetical protein
MSAATDKARFYLEQSVPELKEFEKKKIFSKVRVLNQPFHKKWSLTMLVIIRMRFYPLSRDVQISSTN